MPNRALTVTPAVRTTLVTWPSSECPPSPFTVTYTLTNLEQCSERDDMRTITTIGSSVMLTELFPGSSYVVTVIGKTWAGNEIVLTSPFMTRNEGNM